MKQMILSLLLLLTMTAMAQDKKCDAINEQFFNAKVDELSQRLEMSDEQKTKFVPIYRHYCQEVRAAWGNLRKPKKPLTEEEKLERTKRRMARQQQMQAIRLKYVDEFATVLTPKQVNKFYEVEDDIQKKLMDRRKNHHKKHYKKQKPQND